MSTVRHIDVLLDMKAVEALAERVKVLLAEDVVEVAVLLREVVVRVRKGSITKVLRVLRDEKDCLFKQLMDVTAVDWLGRPEAEDVKAEGARFDVVYHLLSLAHNLRVRVKVAVAEDDTVPSVVEVYPAANWYEREVWDMFGIRFDGHPDLRRILTDYGFEGHPLRKDFPLTGHVEVYFDAKEQRVAYKPVDLPQELRRFDKQSPWEAMTGNARLGDEGFKKEEFV